MRAPAHWQSKNSLLSWLLYPAGFVWGAVAGLRMDRNKGATAEKPVICVGNFTSGGAGKTPVAIALADVAKKAGFRVGYLSRGYGGKERGPVLVDPEQNTSAEVGDEPLLLARTAHTAVAKKRADGAAMLAERSDVDIIIMDDGFQSPNIRKDGVLAVVDALSGIGNGFCIPAGPLRAPLAGQLRQVDMVIVSGTGDGADDVVRTAARQGRAVSHFSVAPDMTKKKMRELGKKQLLAFSGIGYPEKFFLMLEEQGFEINTRMAFDDHHAFDEQEAQNLLQIAGEKDLNLVTTEKDMARLTAEDGYLAKLREATTMIPIKGTFANEDAIRELMVKVVRGV